MKITTIIIGIFMICCWAGWGINLYKFVKCDFETPYKTEIIRSIGIVTPIGAIIGWMDIGEE